MYAEPGLTTPLLSLENFACKRDRAFLFTNLNVTLKPGRLVVISGANGSGKTTLLRTLAGLHKHYLGSVYLGEKCFTQQQSLNQEYLSQMLYIGHKSGVKSHLTVHENMIKFSSLGEDCALEHIDSTLETLQLSRLRDTLVFFLSEGQRRRLALSRLWLQSRRIWLLDEPFAALDHNGIELLQQKIAQQLTQTQGIVVISSHQPLHLADLPTIRINL